MFNFTLIYLAVSKCCVYKVADRQIKIKIYFQQIFDRYSFIIGDIEIVMFTPKGVYVISQTKPITQIKQVIKCIETPPKRREG